MLASIFLTLTSIVKFSLNVEKDDLKELNKLLKKKLTPINYHLGRSNHPEDIQTLGDQANIVIRDFLLEHPEAFEASDTSKNGKFIKHTGNTLEEAIKIKNNLRKIMKRRNTTSEDKKNFRAALNVIKELRKLEKKKEQIKQLDIKRKCILTINGTLLERHVMVHLRMLLRFQLLIRLLLMNSIIQLTVHQN